MVRVPSGAGRGEEGQEVYGDSEPSCSVLLGTENRFEAAISSQSVCLSKELGLLSAVLQSLGLCGAKESCGPDQRAREQKENVLEGVNRAWPWFMYAGGGGTPAGWTTGPELTHALSRRSCARWRRGRAPVEVVGVSLSDGRHMPLTLAVGWT